MKWTDSDSWVVTCSLRPHRIESLANESCPKCTASISLLKRRIYIYSLFVAMCHLIVKYIGVWFFTSMKKSYLYNPSFSLVKAQGFKTMDCHHRDWWSFCLCAFQVWPLWLRLLHDVGSRDQSWRCLSLFQMCDISAQLDQPQKSITRILY